MLVAGAELAAVGQVLREAAKIASPAASRLRAGSDRRADAYGDLQRAVVDLLARLETLVTMQEAVPAQRRAVLGSFLVAASGGIDDTGTGLSHVVARSTRSLSLVLLTREIVERLDADRAVRAEMLTLNTSVARVLSGLTEVRLVGAPDVQVAAENLVAVIGETLSGIPIMKDGMLSRHRPSMYRYERLRSASMFHIRHFGAVARLDLKALPWRRRSRRRAWQFYRPAPPKIQTMDIDLEELIRASPVPG